MGAPEGGRGDGEGVRRREGGEEEFGRAAAEKARRKLDARREGDRGIWFGLGMFGLVGWSVAIPTLAGVALGWWLDERAIGPTGVSWTLTGLVAGVAVGCFNAWYWIRKESGRE